MSGHAASNGRTAGIFPDGLLDDLSRMPPLAALIEGRWQVGAARLPVLEKFTGEKAVELAEASLDQVGEAVRRTKLAAANPIAPFERAAILRRAATLVDRHRGRLIDLMAIETGFTNADATGEIERSILTLMLSAEEATRIVGEVVPFGATPGQERRFGYTIRVPLGLVCVITPFNSPLNTVLHKVAPAIAAGNAVILKPSELSPLTGMMAAAILLEAGLPSSHIAVVVGKAEVGKSLVGHSGIDFYSFTGSTAVGKLIDDGAGLRRTQLELGSIASTIVCADADLSLAASKIANAAFRKAGQVCTSVQRLYVEKPVFTPLLELLVDAARGMRTGNPKDPKTRIGPMISEASAARAETWVREAVDGGARIVIGGQRKRALFEPTILVDVKSGMKVVDDEIFAPVLSLMPFERLEDAVEHANNTPYGLAAGVFTRDVNRAINLGYTLRFGAIHINETSSCRADAMPFGGVKDSGHGLEGPRYAIEQLTETRLITINQ